MNQPALDKYRGREISPGIECQSDAELDEFVRNHADTAFHPCGTCKMGYDEMAVVDGEGRVHGGLEGLRVVDASIMPVIITGNLNATTIMIGEKMADAIRGRQPLAQHRDVLCRWRRAGSPLTGQCRAATRLARPTLRRCNVAPVSAARPGCRSGF